MFSPRWRAQWLPVVMCAGLMSVAAVSPGQTVVRLEVLAGNPGLPNSSFDIAIHVDGNSTTLGSYAFRVQPSGSVVTVVQSQDGGDGFGEAPTLGLQEEDSRPFSATNVSSTFTSGRLAILTFETSGADPLPSYDIELGPEGSTPLVGLNFTLVPHTYDNSGTSGLGGPASFLWGDMNGDGIVGTVDASLILQYDAFLIDSFSCCPEVWPDFPPRGDVNADGVLGTVDAAHILQYDAFLLDCFDADTNCDGLGPD